VETFRRSLRGAAVDARSPVDLQDATTIEMLIQSLDSDDAHQVLTSLDLLEYHDRSYLVPRLLLLHDDPAVRRRTLQLLAHSGRREAASMVERAMEDVDVGVRVEAARTLAALLGEDAAALMAGRLDDPDPRIRSAAIAAVAGDGGDDGREKEAERSLETLLCDADADCRIEAAKALGAMPDPIFDGQLIRLLVDSERRVVRQAILAVGRRMERGEFNALYPPLLISRMSDRRLKHDARDALVACGPEVIPALVHFMNAPEEQLWVRRALPKTMARIGTPVAVSALVEVLGTPDAFLRRKAVEALAELRADRELNLPAATMERRVQEETARYTRDLTDLLALGPGGARRVGPLVRWDGRPPALVHELLADRLRGHVNQIFGLLALVHDASDMEAARRGMLSGKEIALTRALEYLDNTLKGEARKAVMVALGDVTHRVWLEHARRSFGVEPQAREATLARLITTPAEGDGEAPWLAAAALQAVHVLRAADLYPLVRETAAGDADSLVRETATWIATKLDQPA
jgi:HEAT repeat protein